MSLRIRLDGQELQENELTPSGKSIIKNLSYVEAHLTELRQQRVILMKAMNTHISELKLEIVRRKTGVDLRSILNEN